MTTATAAAEPAAAARPGRLRRSWAMICELFRLRVDKSTGRVGLVAIVLAAVNMVGGFVVTDRMLQMFVRKKPKKVSAGSTNGRGGSSGSAGSTGTTRGAA